MAIRRDKEGRRQVFLFKGNSPESESENVSERARGRESERARERESERAGEREYAVAYAYACVRARAYVRNENLLMHPPFRTIYPTNPANPANPPTDGMSALGRERWRESFLN
jgi:hypothetical protein